MGDRHCPCTDRHADERRLQRRIEAEHREQRGNDARRRNHSDGRGALRRLEHRSEQEREEDPHPAEHICMRRDVFHHVGGRDHLAEYTARRRDEKNGADGHETVVADGIELLRPSDGEELQRCERHADAEGDDRRAEELDDLAGEAGHARHGDNGGQCHERNGDDDRGKCAEPGGELAVGGDERRIALRHLIGLRLVLRLYLGADPARIEVACDQREDRAEETEPDHLQEIVADAERARRSDRSRCRRDKDVRDKETGTQRKRHGDRRGSRAADERLADGVQNNEARVAEHGDGDDPAHELYGDDRLALADETDHHIRQLQRTACFLQHRADHRSEDDDDADARERPREALPDHGRKTVLNAAVRELMIDKRDACNEPEGEGDQHDGDKRMNAQL